MLLGSNPDWRKRLKDRKFMLDRFPLFRVGHDVMRSKNETQRPQALKLCLLSVLESIQTWRKFLREKASLVSTLPRMHFQQLRVLRLVVFNSSLFYIFVTKQPDLVHLVSYDGIINISLPQQNGLRQLKAKKSCSLA